MVSGSFTLNITFTVPVGIAGGQSRSFNATVAGIVSPFVGVEGVAIDFNNTPVLFTFNDRVNSGFFTLALEDLFVMRTSRVCLGLASPARRPPFPNRPPSSSLARA